MNINKKNGQRGAALVEFTLVVPLLLLFLFGIIEFSVILYDKAVVTNASREAAREWIEYTPTKMTNSEVEDIVENYALNRLISFGTANPNRLTTTFKINGANAADTTAYATTDLLTVEVQYLYDFLLLPAFVQGFIPDLTLSAETVMRAE